jgi:hypothetical protein
MPVSLPDGPQLLALERQSRQSGSGLSRESLLGTWILQRTWPRGRSTPADLASTLLRGLGASLSLSSPAAAAAAAAPTAPASAPAAAAAAAAELTPLEITNSVRLGMLELRFCGEARLQGRRPLLLFRFLRLQLRLGGHALLDRPLPADAPFSSLPVAGVPFFALIAADPEGSWLAARGKGGGLALWQHAAATPQA